MRVFLLCALTATLQAQSISITSPTSNQVVSGFTGFSFAVNLISVPSVSRVCYAVDGYPATNPGYGALNTAGCSNAAPYSYPYNSFWVMNGPHQVTATGYDALGNVVASSTQPFTVQNTWPVKCSDASGPVLTVSTGTALTSSWNGSQTITAQVTGACSADTLEYRFYIDGFRFYNITYVTNGSAQTATLDTTRYFDGSHVIAVSVLDSTNNTSYGFAGAQNGAAEWSRTVTFSNGAVLSGIRNNYHDFYAAPGASFNAGCNPINADGSAGTALTCYYASSNTSVATVDGSGNVTVANTLPAQVTNAQIDTMGANVSCPDASIATLTMIITSTCHTFRKSEAGELIVITSSSPWIAGTYQINAVDERTNQATLGVPFGANTAVATSASATNGAFKMGPTRVSWVLASTTTSVPHFGRDKTIHNTYDPVNSFFVHEAFGSSVLATDQMYSPGLGYDLSISGFNTLEIGMFPAPMNNYTIAQQSYFQTDVSNSIMIWNNSLANHTFSKPIYTWGTGDNSCRQYPYLFGSTRTLVPPNWTIAGVQYVFQSWGAYGTHPMLGVSMCDEVSSAYGATPLAGPVKFGGATQGGITSISCVSNTCTVNGPSGYSDPASKFIIQNATTSGLNTTNPNIYISPFTPSGSVPDGTYNAATDPNLILQQYWNSWLASTDAVHYDAFATMRSYALAAGAGRPLMSWPAAAGAGCTAYANWGGNSNQAIGGVANIADFGDLYPTHGTSEPYLSSRISLNSVINDPAGFGMTMRTLFGCYSPAIPNMMLTQGTSTNYGFQGYAVPITSISNGLITFAAPHLISNIIPGLSRLTIAGSSNSAYNTNFYIIDAPTPTTLDVVLAQTDFTDTSASGGTLTFADGTQLKLNTAANSLQANGTIKLSPFGGDHILYCGIGAASCPGSADVNVTRHRCQNFTLSGVTGNSAWNARTFNYGCENIAYATGAGGDAEQYIWYREVPNGSSSGGTAAIIADNTYVKGRQGSTQLLDYNPEFTFGTVMECLIDRCAGQRLYQMTDQFQEFQPVSMNSTNGPKAGWGAQAQSAVTLFNDPNAITQLQANPHFENGRAVTIFHAASIGAIMANRWQKYILQTMMNSPDYGQYISCGARTSSYGNILMCWNASDANQTRTFNLSAYLQSGQQIIRSRASYQGISPLAILSAGTTSDAITLSSGEAVFYVFPVNFSAELAQPVLSVRLADVANAAKVAVRYAYDPYLLDSGVANVQDCGNGAACVLNADRTFGAIFYRIFYLSSSNAVLAASDVQTL